MRMTKLRASLILFALLVALPALLLAPFLIYSKLKGDEYHLSIENRTNDSIHVKDVLVDNQSVELKEFIVPPLKINWIFEHGVFTSRKVNKVTLKIIEENGNVASVSCHLKMPDEEIKRCLLIFGYKGISKDASCGCDNLDETDYD
ncbi:hypothetical protein FUT69_02540 [Xylella taiwanensis]|nr:hypothetical protein AB672_08655 [Xylella taiwanensis]NBI36116.1 hypothetical protein [Xylella taiwanensis]QKD99601.1 hypothetical protein PLS229_08695 [Xylella taiwanensis]